MGSIKKIGDSYYIEFDARGLKYRQEAGPDKKEARVLLKATEEKIRKGEAGTVSLDVTIESFLTDFSRFASVQYPPQSAKRLKNTLAHFAKFLTGYRPDPRLLSQLTPKVIEDYKFFLLRGKEEHCSANHQGLARNAAIRRSRLKPWVINFTILLLREIFEYAIKSGGLNDNPTLHIKLVADDRRMHDRFVHNARARAVLDKGISLFRFAHLMKMGDVLRAMPFYRLLRDPLNE